MAEANKRVPSIWTTGWTDVLNTGTWRNAIAIHQRRPAPCHAVCPVNGDIPVWVHQARSGDFFQAWQTLVENNPIPAAIGRTCHHPCEGRCNRNEYDGAVSINALEQFVGDMAIEQGWTFAAPLVERAQHVAIIGGGPAGLSCAYQLRRKGFQVTIFDANPELGGVLRYGVPEYRLPKEIVAAEVNKIVDLGVEVIAGCRVKGEMLEKLEKTYSAVFIAFGAHAPKWLSTFPRGDGRVLDAVSFLRSVRMGAPLPLGRKVTVIGGGSVAMDVAGSALRLGSDVTVVALESRTTMPAPEDEILDVLAEGGRLFDGSMVKSVTAEGGKFALRCVNVELDSEAPAGVVRPIEVGGESREFDADTIILAVGQDPELIDWETCLAVVNGMIVVDQNFGTSKAGVFAAGDVVSSERFVSCAVGDGKRTANSIASFLGCPDTFIELDDPPPKEVSFQDINTFYFPSLVREERVKVDAEARKVDFREIRQGYTSQQMQEQAERCFSCGSCIECDNCYYFCPDMAIVKDATLPLHYGVLDQFCKGCGCCVEECPRGAMGAKEEAK